MNEGSVLLNLTDTPNMSKFFMKILIISKAALTYISPSRFQDMIILAVQKRPGIKSVGVKGKVLAEVVGVDS